MVPLEKKIKRGAFSILGLHYRSIKGGGTGEQESTCIKTAKLSQSVMACLDQPCTSSMGTEQGMVPVTPDGKL